MRVYYAPFKFDAYGEAEIEAVVEALRDGWLGVGPRVAKFEAEMSALFGKRRGVMVNSGSSANILAAEELTRYSKVATPALTFTTTVAFIHHQALLCDIEPTTYQIDFTKLPEEPDALFVPNLLGNIPDWDKAPDVAVTVEDSCDTITSAGKSRSRIATTSFYASHVITAGGGGGMLLTDDDDVAERAASKRAWGRPIVEESDLERRFRPLSDDDPMTYDSRFIYEFIGYNFQPIEMEAAFGLQQLRRLDDFLAIRQKNFDRLKAFFSSYEDRFVLPETRAGANWLAFPLTIREGLDRTDFARHLEENEIQTRPIFSGNIARQPAYRDVLQQGSFPVADKVMKDGLLLGCHHGMNEEQLTYLEEVCSAYLAS